jgi:hypothetical protein
MMRLATNWRKLWKGYSTQALFFIGLIQMVVSYLPQGSLLPGSATYTWADLAQAATAVLAVLGFIGRHVDQSSVSGEA